MVTALGGNHHRIDFLIGLEKPWIRPSTSLWRPTRLGTASPLPRAPAPLSPVWHFRGSPFGTWCTRSTGS
jgi:hypothetical protein